MHACMSGQISAQSLASPPGSLNWRPGDEATQNQAHGLSNCCLDETFESTFIYLPI